MGVGCSCKELGVCRVWMVVEQAEDDTVRRWRIRSNELFRVCCHRMALSYRQSAKLAKTSYSYYMETPGKGLRGQ